MDKLKQTLYEIEKDELEVIKKIQHEGFCIWPLFRWWIFRNEFVNGISNSNSNSNMSILKRLAQKMYLLSEIKYLYKYFKIRKSDVLFKTYTNYRRDMIDGNYKEIFIGDIINDIEPHTFTIIENLGTYKKHFSNVKEKHNIVYGDLLEQLSKLVIIKNKAQYNTIIDSVEYIITKYGFTAVKVENIKRILYSYIKLKIAYKWILKKINPQSAVVICSYGGNECFIAAAKELNINVIEIQHGNINDFEAGYCYSEYIRKIGNMRFPVPDYFFSYGDKFTEIIKRDSLINSNNIITTGNPRLDFWKNKIKLKSDAENKINVLVTSQPYVTDDLISFMKQADAILKTKNISNIFLNIKLHPGEVASLDKWKLVEKECKFVNIIEGDSVNLYKYFVESAFHASVYSSSHIEAICLGIPTIIIRINNNSFYRELSESGVALEAYKPEEFIDKIQFYHTNPIEHEKLVISMEDYSKSIQKSNAISNMKEALNSILNKR